MSIDQPLPEILSVHLDQFARAFRAASAGRVREKALAQVVAAVEQATAALHGR